MILGCTFYSVLPPLQDYHHPGPVVRWVLRASLEADQAMRFHRGEEYLQIYSLSTFGVTCMEIGVEGGRQLALVEE